VLIYDVTIIGISGKNDGIFSRISGFLFGISPKICYLSINLITINNKII